MPSSGKDYTVPLTRPSKVSADLAILPLGPTRVTGQHFLPDAEQPPEAAPSPHAGTIPLTTPRPVSTPQSQLSNPSHPEKPSTPKTSTPVIVTANWALLLPVLQPPLRLSLGLHIGLPSPLYPYQTKGVEFLADTKAALLGDDMGTGKTVQTCVALRILLQQGRLRTALIVCPLSVLPNWQGELAKWAPNIHTTLVRGTIDRRMSAWESPSHVWLTTYDTLRNDCYLLEATRRGQFDLLVLDEAQKVKNSASATTRAVRGISAKYRWGLTGTPLENNIEELCTILRILDPALGARSFATATDVQKVLRPMFLRRRKIDVLSDLPDLTTVPVWLPLEPAQRKSYEEFEEKGVLQLHARGRTMTAHCVMVLLSSLKQICNRCPRTGESSKLNWVRENLDEISSQGDKAILFTQFREDTTAGALWLTSELSAFNPLYYGTANTDAKRAAILAAFQHNPVHKVFIGHPKSAGVGLNELVVANYVIHFDHWWNPATTNQATARAHRPGQTKKVTAYDLWIEDTFEQVIFRLLDEKQALYNDIVDSLSARKEPEESLAFEVANRLFKKYGLRPL